MPLVTSKKMFEDAYKGGYAVGAFNVNNMEIIQGIVQAGTKLNAPLILQVSKGASIPTFSPATGNEPELG